jgi:hypothetical protein
MGERASWNPKAQSLLSSETSPSPLRGKIAQKTTFGISPCISQNASGASPQPTKNLVLACPNEEGCRLQSRQGQPKPHATGETRGAAQKPGLGAGGVEALQGSAQINATGNAIAHDDFPPHGKFPLGSDACPRNWHGECGHSASSQGDDIIPRMMCIDRRRFFSFERQPQSFFWSPSQLQRCCQRQCSGSS